MTTGGRSCKRCGKPVEPPTTGLFCAECRAGASSIKAPARAEGPPDVAASAPFVSAVALPSLVPSVRAPAPAPGSGAVESKIAAPTETLKRSEMQTEAAPVPAPEAPPAPPAAGEVAEQAAAAPIPEYPELAAISEVPRPRPAAPHPATNKSTPPSVAALRPASVLPAAMRDLLPGKIAGHEITGILGSGGMGKVFLAKEPVLGREVALKVLKPKDVHELLLMHRLLDEAVVTGRLGHPGIVPIYQVGKDPDFGLWYTMKVVEGKSLEDILNDLREEIPAAVERYTLPALLDIFKRTCEAIGFSHHHGVVHRDVKPANIMIGEFGEVVVMDWGLARMPDERAEHEMLAPASAALLAREPGGESQKRTAVRTIKGTPGYMSPEQANADPAGPASDVYALGSILYQMLTKRLPVDGRGVQEILAKTVAGQIIPPEKRAGVRGLPKALCQMAMKALSLKPEARFPTARELAHEVEAYLDGRVPWQPREDGWQSTGGAWDTQEGRLRSGPGVKSKAFHRGRLGGDVRFKATIVPSKDRTSLDTGVWLAVPSLSSPEGYLFRLLTGERGRVEFLRNGAIVARRLDIPLDAGLEHRAEIVREGPRLRLFIDDQLAIDHREVFPMRGDRLAVSTESSGVSLASVTVESHGPPLQLDFLALPDKVLSMGQMKEARMLYRDMAEAHADRSEGVIARFKAAQCSIEMGELPEAQADLKLLEGTGYEALGVLGQAKIRQKEGKGKEMWAVLLQGMEKHRGDPARLELRAMANGVLEQAERESPAAARDLYMQMLTVPGLMPHETAQVCADFLRMSAVAGPDKVRQEAMALLDAHKQRIELRMECHAALARLDLPKENAPAVRGHLEKTLGLTEGLNDDDRVRLVLWLTESLLGGGNIGEAEALLASVAASMEPKSLAAFRIRHWRTLLSCAQGNWSGAQKLLGADLSPGTTPHHYLGLLLATLTANSMLSTAKALGILHERSEKVADWKAPSEALAGKAPGAGFVRWLDRQPGELHAPLAVASAMILSARGDKPGAEAMRACAAADKIGKSLTDWMLRNKRWA
ncbi:MAG: protein kinase [Planctomycetota bacterium]